MSAGRMLMSTTDTIPGRDFEVLGVVTGSICQSKHIGRDIAAGLKTIVGGEIKGYTELLNDARAVATSRMQDEARTIGADAVIGVRYQSCSIMANASEVVCFGTAVKFR